MRQYVVASICYDISMDNLFTFMETKINAKPFLKWAGGKSQLVQSISRIMDNADLNNVEKYAEPFIGGGAMLFYVLQNYSFREIFISDKNKNLVNTYLAVKNDVIEIIKILKDLQNKYNPARTEERQTIFYEIRDFFNSTSLNGNVSVEKAAWFIFLNKTCFNGLYRVNRLGHYNVPMGKYTFPKICDEENLTAVSDILQNVQIVCGDYSVSDDFIDKNTLAYFDPPYRPISKTATFTAYNAESFSDDEQKRLADFIKQQDKKGAKIILSNSDPKNSDPYDNFFDNLYSDFEIKRVPAMRAINSKGSARGKINELIITNIKGDYLL